MAGSEGKQLADYKTPKLHFNVRNPYFKKAACQASQIKKTYQQTDMQKVQ